LVIFVGTVTLRPKESVKTNVVGVGVVVVVVVVVVAVVVVFVHPTAIVSMRLAATINAKTLLFVFELLF
jgi:hypothetical protein